MIDPQRVVSRIAEAVQVDVTSLGKYLENGGSQSFARGFVPLLHFWISATACFQEVHKQAMREGVTEKAILLGNDESDWPADGRFPVSWIAGHFPSKSPASIPLDRRFEATNRQRYGSPVTSESQRSNPCCRILVCFLVVYSIESFNFLTFAVLRLFPKTS